MPNPVPTNSQAQQLLEEHIQNEALRHHCRMVAQAMQAYASKFEEDEALWFQTGLLHDLDWEEFPDEHPNKAVGEWLSDYPPELINAVKAHAPHRTGVQPASKLERYLFACDELSGFLHAYSLMRPQGFAGMKASKVLKKLGDKSFAAKVSREDIQMGLELIEEEPSEHVQFLIDVFLKFDTN